MKAWLIAVALAGTPPTAPALEAPAVSACSPYGLQLRWAPAQDDGQVSEYVVAVDGSTAARVPAASPQPAAYERFVDGDSDFPLARGRSYEVSVTAVDDTGQRGEASRRTVTVPPVGAPGGLSGSFEAATVRLGWAAAAGACGYEIRRGDRGAIATLGPQATGFVDPEPVHGSSRYDVVPLDHRGRPHGGASVVVAEPLPALPATPTCRARETPITSSNLEAASMASVCLVNFERVRRGLQPLHVDARLTAAATGHARDEARRDYYEHTNPDGCDPSCRAEAAGYPAGAAENLFAGPDTAKEAVDGWLESSGHRANILDPTSRTIGSGTAMGGPHGKQWVHTFGDVPAPMSAVSGLEPQFQGAADPSPQSPSVSRVAAKLRVRSGRDGLRLRVHATLTRRASGSVRVSYRTRGRTFSFRVPIRAGRAKTTRRLPAWARGTGRATLTVRFGGDAGVRSQTVRLSYG